MSRRLQFVEPRDADEWDDFVGKCPTATAFHSAEWKRALNASFPPYVPNDRFVVIDGATTGAWSSVAFSPAPFFTFGEAIPWHLPGGLISPQESAAAADYLDALAEWESEARRAGRCALTLTVSPKSFPAVADALPRVGFEIIERKLTHLLDLPSDRAALWDSYKGSVRTDTRKAEKSGVSVRAATADPDIDRFYTLYANAMDRFDNLPKPLSLVRDLVNSSIARLLVAEREGRIIAGLLHLHFARTLTIWMATSEPTERRSAPNHALYDTALSWAVERGYARVDFGASPPENRGLVKFKESFGAVRADFGTFRKEIAPLRAAAWRAAEPFARKLYGAVYRR